MAQTPDTVLKLMIGDMVANIAQLSAKVEELQEQKEALERALSDAKMELELAGK